MSGTPHRDDQQLALAVTRFIEDVHEWVPQAHLEPMTPYEDEDFTLAVIIPPEMDKEAVLDHCLAASATIEDEMEVYILPRVRADNS